MTPLRSQAIDYFVSVQPAAGWRRWEITPSRVSDQTSGTLLRGALGQVWKGPHATAKCLYMRAARRPLLGAVGGNGVAGRHTTPAPDPDCRCGIHAIKVGVVGDLGSPWEPRYPSVSGFVELAGTVIEGARGFRGETAEMIGPLEMVVPCAAGHQCDIPVEAVATHGTRYVGLCPHHLDSTRGAESLDIWLNRVIPSLEKRYVGPIVF